MRLEQIFNEFSDDKAKIQFLLQLQHNDVPKAFASRAMEFLIEKGYQREAAVFAEKAGRIDDAIQLHIEREAFNAAGEVAERHNRDVKELYNMHIDEEIREGTEWYYIRNYAKEKGLFRRAVEMYEKGAKEETIRQRKAEHFKDGASLAEKHGLPDARRMYSNSSIQYELLAEEENDGYWTHSHYWDAIRMAGEAEDGNRVSELTRKVSEMLINGWAKDDSYYWNIVKNHRIFMEQMELTDEIIFYESGMALKSNDYEGAGDVYAKYERTEQAREFYSQAIESCEKSGKFERALRIAKKAGLEKRVKMLEQVQEVLS
jgi:tetratricopeptide (TPR) repeat protein